jgi:AcrR family transcriptional regulator
MPKQEHSGARIRPSPDAVPRQQRRRTRTRDALLDAAKTLLAARAHEGFTIDEVVDLAGVAKGSFYNHFADKEELIGAVCRQIRAKEESAVQAANAGVTSPGARIARAIAVYARLAMTAPDEAQIVRMTQAETLSVDSDLNAGLVRDLREGLKLGKVTIPSIEAGSLLVLGQAAILMARLRRMQQNEAAAMLAQQCIALVLIGLGLEYREANQIATQAVDDILTGGTADAA